MNKTHVYVSNGDFILDWQFRTSANLNANSSNNPNAPNKEAKFSAIDGKVMTGRIVIINNYWLLWFQALRQQKQAKDRAFHIDNVQVLGTPETSNISDLKKKG